MYWKTVSHRSIISLYFCVFLIPKAVYDLRFCSYYAVCVNVIIFCLSTVCNMINVQLQVISLLYSTKQLNCNLPLQFYFRYISSALHLKGLSAFKSYMTVLLTKDLSIITSGTPRTLILRAIKI